MKVTRRTSRVRALVATITLVAITSGCSVQSLRDSLLPRSAAEAARATVSLDPARSDSDRETGATYQGPKHPSWWTGGASTESIPAEIATQGFDDSWERIRSGMRLPHVGDGRVKREIAWFAKRQDYLDRVAERATPYLPYITEQVAARDMPMEIALLPIVESAFQPLARSSMSAAGIWQFMPATGRVYGLKQTWWYDGRRDVVNSTRAALDYLQKLVTDFEGDWLLAVAAYNAGEGNVQRAIDRNRRRGKPTDFWSLDLPRETESYVPKLLAVAALVANPDDYGVTLRPIPNEQYFDLVDLDGQIDLALAADLADISMDELKRLNPGFSRWATDPEGPHQLVLPVGSTELFSQRLAGIPDEDRVRWAHHKVRNGESLGLIARRYRTSVRELQRLNKLRGTLIRVGQSLVVPASGLSAATMSAAAGAGNTATDDTPHRTTYVVRNGDSLWLIARQHGTSVKSIARSNGLSTSSVLRPGQTLKVVATSDDIVASAAAEPSLRRISYTVRSGDSLWRISRRFGVSVGSVKRWNQLRGSALRPGQRLKLYVESASAT